MKLKNRKTGEIIDGGFVLTYYDGIAGNPQHSLAELNEEWEDVPEEPKEYWYISDFGYVFNHEINNKSVKSTIEEMKSIGNYFLSREEAEKAVEKLKAWKRLRDKGFRFTGFSSESIGYEIKELSGDFALDLDLLFNGGEE